MSRKTEFMMHGMLLNSKTHIGGWVCSEKLDGQRCIWDGGVTRGWKKSDVEWANVGKDDRYKQEQYSTGLWSRYGHPIYAPDWWLDQLPKGVIIDGELYIGRKSRQELMTIVRCQPTEGSMLNDLGWNKVRLMAFDSPSYYQFFEPRTIEYGHKGFKTKITPKTWKIMFDLARQVSSGGRMASDHIIHDSAIFALGGLSYNETQGAAWYVITEQKLPLSDAEARQEVAERAAKIVHGGGEGLIIRDPNKEWEPRRVNWLCKVKPTKTDTGIVISINPGLGRLKGMMGNITVENNGVIFNIGTGFTDEDRQLIVTEQGISYARCQCLKVGDTVMYEYRELSNDGVPIESRYICKVS